MKQALYQAAILTFEELGFMFPAESTEPKTIASDKCVNIVVGFNGEISGSIVLTVENAILPELALNMLGEDFEPNEEMLIDVIGEVTNVICGNTLPLISGYEAIFNLDAPEKIESEKLTEKPEAIAHLDLEGNQADIRIYTNNKTIR